jgi:hypothetical protein
MKPANASLFHFQLAWIALLWCLLSQLPNALLASERGTRGSASIDHETQKDIYLKNFELSGPVFVFLRKFGVNVDIVELDESFGQSTENPLDRIVRVAKLNGLEITHKKIHKDNVKSIPVPSLLVLSKTAILNNRPSDTQHQNQYSLVYAHSHSSNGLMILDVGNGVRRVTVPYDQLSMKFPGDVLCHADKVRLIGIELFVFCSGLLLLAAAVYKRHSTAFKLFVFLFLAHLFLVGCSTNESGGTFGIFNIDQRNLDLGEISDENHHFKICLTPNVGGRVTAIATSCGCITIDENLMNAEFVAGQPLDLSFELSLKGHAGFSERTVLISCLASNGAVSDSSIPIKYSVKCRPFVNKPVLVFKRFLNEDVFKTSCTVVRRRASNEPKLEIVNSNFIPYELVLDEFKSVLAGGAGATIDDIWYFSMSVTSTERRDIADEVTEAIRFEFENHEHTDAEVQFQEIHPCELEMNRIFLGMVETNSNLSHSLSLSNMSNSEFVIQNIEAVGIGKILRQPTILKGGEGFEVQVLFDSGKEPGRHSVAVSIEFDGLPNKEVILSWVNR